jgi:hypothetical protein
MQSLSDVFAVLARTLSELLLLLAHGIATRNPAAMLVPFVMLFWILRRVISGPRRTRVPRRDTYSYLPPRFPEPYRPAVPPGPARPAVPPGPARRAGHPDYCPCRDCRAASVTPEPEPMRPPPSARTEPGPCRHELIATVRDRDLRLLRYTCANWQCDTVWPPDTEWPPGTKMYDPREC